VFLRSGGPSGGCADQGSVAPRFLSDEVSTRRRHRFDASTPPLALNSALNAERDGALSSDGTSGADNALMSLVLWSLSFLSVFQC
jgi:hypothetical protein